MTPVNAQPLLDAALAAVHACRLEGGAGRYSRVPGNPNAAPDPQGVAAAATILYSLGIFPGRAQERAGWTSVLHGFQDSVSGLCAAPGVEELPATAAVAAALDLFDERLESPPHRLLPLTAPSALVEFLARLNWADHPVEACREAAALYTILTTTEQAGLQWESAYFRWLREETDEHTGLLRRDCISPVEVDGQWTLQPYLVGQYFLLCSYVHARRPHALPWRLIDTALEVMEYHRELFCHRLGHRHLPWIFCLTRSLRVTPHRHEEVIHALERFLPRYLDFLEDRARNGHFTDLTLIRTSVAALAELQIALPGRLLSRRPLRQVLDRVSFLG